MPTLTKLQNSAIITTPDHDVQISLSEHGDRVTVEAFLEFMRLQGADSLSDKHGDGRDLLLEVANDFAAHDCGYLYRDSERTICTLDDEVSGKHSDNGVYVVDDDWRIVGREFFDGHEDYSENLLDRLYDINDSVTSDLVVDESELELAKFDLYDTLSDEEIVERESWNIFEDFEASDRSQVLSELGDAISGVELDDLDTAFDFSY